MSEFIWGPKTEWDKRKLHDTAPVPFIIPKGYKSMRLEVEMSLENLWAGNKKFLRQFHKPAKVSAKDKRGENLLGLEFNTDAPRETNPPA